MACRSGIYVVNTAQNTIQAGGTIPVNTVIHRYGNGVNQSGYGVSITTPGYYDVSINATIAPVASGAVTVALLQNGTAIPGAQSTFSADAANEAGTISIRALIRKVCCAVQTALTATISAQANATNVSMTVTKI